MPLRWSGSQRAWRRPASSRTPTTATPSMSTETLPRQHSRPGSAKACWFVKGVDGGPGTVREIGGILNERRMDLYGQSSVQVPEYTTIASCATDGHLWLRPRELAARTPAP